MIIVRLIRKYIRMKRSQRPENHRAWPIARVLLLVGAFGLLVLASACSSLNRVIVPKGEPAERAKAARAEGSFAVPVNKRPLPDLSGKAPLPLVLEYAFNSNGELEAAYRDWRAAIERIPQAGALPDPMLDFSFIFGPGSLDSFSSALDSIRLMIRQDVPAGGKRQAMADVALAEAQATGEKFRASKYRLQKDVVSAYADLALNRADVELESENLRLLNQSYNVGLQRYSAGGETNLADLRKLEVEIETAKSELQGLLIEQKRMEGTLNGVLNRPPDAALGEVALPEVGLPSLSDAELFAKAVQSNPELAGMRKDIEARGAAQVLAELQKKPDYSFSAGVDMMLNPMLSIGMTLPINRERIRAGIAEALANRQAAETRLRSSEFDVQARLVMALTLMRDANRILTSYREKIIPKNKELFDTQLSTYGSGGGDILDLLDTERLLIEFRKLVLQAESDRARGSAEVEEVIGEDVYRYMPSSAEV